MHREARRGNSSPAHGRAWIETGAGVDVDAISGSRPLTGGRGLKHEVGQGPHRGAGRPLTGGRGLKLVTVNLVYRDATSPAHGRAWIETP